MKKVTVLVLLVALISGKAMSQKEEGQMVVTASAGYSLLMGLYSELDYTGYSYEVNSYSIPAVNGMFDFGLSEKFSMGVAFTYQHLGQKFTGYDYYSPTSGQTEYADFDAKITKMNFAVRPLFHFGSNADLDIYTGFRLGYTMWGAKDDSPEEASWVDSSIKLNVPSFQYLFGVNYYFTDMIGINFEAGLIGPYMAAGGLSLRF